MRIILTQAEMEEAIEDYIVASVNGIDDKEIHIDLKATRGEEGYQAFIDLVPVGAARNDRTQDETITANEDAPLGIVEKIEAARSESAQPIRRRGRPPGSKNKPKEEVAEAELPLETAATETEAEEAEPTSAPEPEVQPEPVSEPEPVVEDTVEVETQDEPEIEVEADPEPTEEEALAAEAQKTEPVEEPTPEPVQDKAQNEASEDAAPAPKPTRSLFANLTKPTNG